MKTIFLIISLLILFPSFLYAGDNNAEIDKILSSAESLFKIMKQKNYPKIWVLLSEKSKHAIIDDVRKAEEKIGKKYSKEDVGEDFAAGSLLSKQYWNNYLDNFNPDWVLEESRWEMGKIQKNQAEVIIRYKKSEGPTMLKMFKEQGKWVVGLRETWG